MAGFASIWHAFGDLPTMTHKAAVLAEHCAAIGRDPADIEHSTAAPKGADRPAPMQWLAAGIAQFTVGVSGPDYDLSEVADLGAVARRHGTVHSDG